MQSVFCPNSPIAKLEKLQWSPALLSTLCKFALHSPVVYFQIFNISLLILPCSGAFGRCFFREMNFGFSFKWSTLYESWDVQLFFDTLINAFKFKVKPIGGTKVWIKFRKTLSFCQFSSQLSDFFWLGCMVRKMVPPMAYCYYL